MGYKLKRIMMWVNAIRLPAEYQEVERIGTSGSQWIDTGVTATTSTKTEIKLNSQYIAESAIFGSQWALNGYFLMFYNNAIRWHGASAVDIPCSLNTDYTIQTENGKITINGTSYTCNASSAILTGYNLGIFATGNQANAYTRGSFKLYYFKVWNGTTLQRDFVPCYRKSDNVIGMYDLVTNTFYTNNGSGTFTKGNDVPDMVEKQVRPSGGGGWQPGANTIAYYPLDSTNTVNDLSGNNYTLTTSHTNPTFGTYQGVDCASFNGSNTELKTASVNPGTYGSNFTVSCWVYGDATGDRVPVCNIYYSNTWLNRQIRAHPSWSSIFELNGASGTNTSFGISANAQAWHNLLFTANGNNITAYVDGVQVATGTNTKWNNNGTFTLGCGWNEGDSYYGWFKGGLSNVIVENKVWTADEVAEYYNLTKGNYGL